MRAGRCEGSALITDCFSGITITGGHHQFVENTAISGSVYFLFEANKGNCKPCTAMSLLGKGNRCKKLEGTETAANENQQFQCWFLISVWISSLVSQNFFFHRLIVHKQIHDFTKLCLCEGHLTSNHISTQHEKWPAFPKGYCILCFIRADKPRKKNPKQNQGKFPYATRQKPTSMQTHSCADFCFVGRQSSDGEAVTEQHISFISDLHWHLQQKAVKMISPASNRLYWIFFLLS